MLFCMQAFGQAFANTVGLFISILFLGFGIIELPRNLWRRANYSAFERRCKGLAVSSKEHFDKCQEELQRAASNVVHFEELLRDSFNSQQNFSDDHKLTMNGELQLVKALLPSDADTVPGLQNLPTSIRKKVYKYLGVKKSLSDLDEEEQHRQLVKLHGKLRTAVVKLNKAQCKWSQLVDRTLELRENLRHMEPSRRDKWIFESDLLQPLSWPKLEMVRKRALFLWRVFLQPPLLRCCAILCAILGAFFLIAAMATIPYAVALEYDNSHVKLSPIEFLIGVPDSPLGRNAVLYICIGYYTFCCLYSLFRLRVASLYELYSGATDGYTITLNTLLLMRIIPPLLWFFYGLVYEAAQIQTTQMLHWQEKQRLPPVQMDPALHNVTTEFAVVMSYINVVPLLGPHFSLYIPPMLLFWTWVVFRNTMTRCMRCPCLRCFRLHHYAFSEEEDANSDRVRRGEQLIEEARQARTEISRHRPATSVGWETVTDREALLAESVASPSDSEVEAQRFQEQTSQGPPGPATRPVDSQASSTPKWHSRLLSDRPVPS
jgi:hypothetical protein